MQPTISALIRQLEDLYSGNNWVAVGTQDLLDGIDGATALQKKLENRHSILEILQHLNAWRTFLLKRLQGDSVFTLSQNDGVEYPDHPSARPEMWDEARKNYHQLHVAIIDQLQRSPESLLGQTVPQRTYNFAFLINGVVQHDFYHLGQISLLR
ncbi:DinB family protein [Flavilitoribacter nigricans]|nr:DinB family protein [Flavilitoribacter nigricans]